MAITWGVAEAWTFLRRVRVAARVAFALSASVAWHYVLIPLVDASHRIARMTAPGAAGQAGQAGGQAGQGGRAGCELDSVHVLNEDPFEIGGYHRDITLEFRPESWEDDARDLTDWDAFRVEVRYVLGGQKYRMVLRPGDACVFPPYGDDDDDAPAGTGTGRGVSPPRGVLAAALVGENRETDVTSRVRKYQGPRGDFHAGLGLKTRVKDMFPFDDHDDNARRYHTLRVIDAAARVAHFDYAAAVDM